MAPLAPSKFVQTYLPLAQQWEGRTGIPASMYLAIIASESNWGNADNALFGIKGSGDAGSLDSATWESEGGQRVNTRAGFANYSSANAAFQGFWDLMNTPYYASALKELKVNHDPDAFLHRINQLNYATDPNWADKIQSSARSTMGPLIQQAGGTTMGQMQAGNPPPADNSPALPGQMSPGPDTSDPEIAAIIAQAANGDTAAPTSAPGDATGGPSAATGSGIDGTTILRMIEAKLGGGETEAVVSSPTIPNKDEYSKYDTPTLPNPVITKRYTWPNGKSVDIVFETGKPAYVKGGTALSALATGSAPQTQTFPDGSLRQYDPDSKQWTVIGTPPANKANPAPKTVTSKSGTYQYDNGTWTLIPGTEPPGARVQIHQMPDGSLQQYDPDTGQWTMVQPRYVDPSEAAYKTALTNEANANTAKTQQGLRPIALAAIQDAGATIEAIKQQWVSGALGTGREAAQKAQALMDQVSQGLSATLAGTTIFDLNKQAQDTATQRASTAASLVNQRVQSSSSLGAALFSAATANGGILMPKGGGSWNINPLDIANQEVNQMGGGQQTGDAATAFLRSVFGGGSPAAGASPTDAGAPQQGQFPTTREAVLAQYPHLATPPPTQNAQFIPPNLEQGAGGPGIAPMQQTAPTVLPPRPLSPVNARMQAGG